jgi:patatin-like phospholipase/acyl hydrolase
MIGAGCLDYEVYDVRYHVVVVKLNLNTYKINYKTDNKIETSIKDMDHMCCRRQTQI